MWLVRYFSSGKETYYTSEKGMTHSFRHTLTHLISDRRVRESFNEALEPSVDTKVLPLHFTLGEDHEV